LSFFIWLLIREHVMNLPSRITLREVGPRDGFQSLKDFIPTRQKLETIKDLVEAGVREIETTSFVSPKAVPQLADAAELMAKVPRKEVHHSVLIPNFKGAQNAVAAGADKIVVLISASESHNQANIRRSIADSLADFDPIFSLARENRVEVIGSAAVAFGCPYQGEVPEADVFRILDPYAVRKVNAVIIADTTGMATPLRVERMVARFRERYPEIPLALHFHNNRGTAMANLLTAAAAGAAIFDTALGGIGGCPYVPQAAGNLPTEDVVCMLADMGIETGIDLLSIIRAARRLEEVLGYTLPGQVMKSGPRDPRLAAEICGIGDHP
jgi:hydroxymethylglutaryl-CoA lyase